MPIPQQNEARRTSNEVLAKDFLRRLPCPSAPDSKIYHNDTPSPCRAIAEFEDMGGVLIAYPGTVPQPKAHIQLPPAGRRSFGIPNELIVRMQQADTDKPVSIFIMCADQDQKAIIINDLAKTAKEKDLAFDPDLIHLISWDTDTFWTRDYGPWWMHNEITDYYAIVKHTYTTLGGGSVGLVEGAEGVDPHEGSGIFRPNDDYGAVKLSDFLNNPIRAWNDAKWGNKPNVKKLPKLKVHNWYYLGLLEVGGNYMVTGDGIIASSYLVATQNELPVKKEFQTTNPCADVVKERMEYVLEQFNRFMGLDTFHVLSDPSGTYIGHIDCWGKFLAPRKVLLAQSEDPKINKAYNAIADSFKEEGFKVFRVMCQNLYIPNQDPTTAAYTNSLILNDYVYVPITGREGKDGECDQEALEKYREALPTHTVIGIPPKPEFPWLGTDAMHCRTHGIPRAVVETWKKSLLINK